VDTVTSAGDGSTFEPRHSTKGFQYVRVEGLPALAPDAITSVVVHSDLARLGGFGCSDARIERLHRVADWSFRGNACELPTDCPTRERAGWVGDWQLYVDTAAYLYDVGDWTARWLRDLAADQLPSGAVTNIVPDPNPDARTWKEGHGAAGWGDAAVHVPWEIHRATGRTDVLADQLGSMRRWVDFAAGLAARGRHPDRAERHPDPRPHDAYLWDTGWHFGEWLQPGDDMDDFVDRLLVEDHGAVATAYLHRSASELARIGAVLGDDEVAERYGTLAGHVLDAWRTEFVDAGGRVTPHTQATLVRALAFGLVPDGLRARAADDLVALVRAAGTHLATGFLATPFLLPVLADHGHLATAYQILLQPDYPGWGYMAARGGTTIWERWDGIRPDGSFQDAGMNSFNHYAYGAVGEWMYRVLAGLDIDDQAPGYKHVIIRPQPGGHIATARARHESMYGPVMSGWKADGSRFELNVEVPPNTTATVHIPRAHLATTTESGQPLQGADGVLSAIEAKQDGDGVFVELGSGRYQFVSIWH
jgi:alpha-L-rhamnosidase